MFYVDILLMETFFGVHDEMCFLAIYDPTAAEPVYVNSLIDPCCILPKGTL
jgi:hypothetical protein